MKRVTKRLKREPAIRCGGNKSVSAFKASAAAFAAWEAQSEGGKRGSTVDSQQQSRDTTREQSKSRDRIASTTPSSYSQCGCTKGQNDCCPRSPSIFAYVPLIYAQIYAHIHSLKYMLIYIRSNISAHIYTLIYVPLI